MITETQALELVRVGGRHIARANLNTNGYSVSEKDLQALSVSFDTFGTDFITVNASVAGLGRHNFTTWDFRPAPNWRLNVDLLFPDLGRLARFETLRVVGRRSKINSVRLSHLTFQSPESLVRDAGAFESRQFDHTWTAASAIARIIRSAAPSERLTNNLPDRSFLDEGEIMEWKDYRNPWAIVQEICDLADAQAYHDGHQFIIEPIDLDGSGTPFLVTADVLQDFSFSSDRDQFANAATVEFDNGVVGTHEITTGDLATTVIARKLKYVQVPRAGGRGQAMSRAAAIAQQAQAEGLTADLQIAGLPLSLRPSNLVAIAEQGLTGVIQSIDFDVLNAQTSIKLQNIKGI